MPHASPQPPKPFLHNFPTRNFIRKPEFPVEIPVRPASESKQHARNKRIACANRATKKKNISRVAA